MSSHPIKNGFYEIDTGNFCDVDSRSDFPKNGPVQRLLERNHYKVGNVICGCGIKWDREDNAVILERREIVSVRLASGKYNGVRRILEGHEKNCFMCLPSDAKSIEHHRLPSILGPIPPSDFRKDADVDGSGSGSRKQYETFSEYARKLLSRGVAKAASYVNVGLNALRNPTAAETLAAINGAVRDFPFDNETDGYANSLLMGCRLRLGLVFDSVFNEGLPCSHVSVSWWQSGNSYSLEPAAVDPRAMETAVADLTIHAHHQQPPYFILGVQGTNNCLQRVYLHQLAVDESHFVPVESGIEAAYAVRLFRLRDALIIKIVRKDDVPGLLEHLGIRLLDGQEWPFRTDFIIPLRSKDGLGLRVREVRGKPVGEDKDYDDRLERSACSIKALRATVPIKYKEIDGTGFKWSPPCDGPERWKSAKVTLEPYSQPQLVGKPIPRTAPEGETTQ